MITMKITNGDLVVDSRGRMVTVTSLDKVSQEVMESLLIKYNPPRTSIGSEFSTIIDRYLASSRVTSYVHNELTLAVNRLKKLQSSQRPALPDDEVIERIEGINISQPQVGEIRLSFRVIVRSGQSRTISTDIVLNSLTLDSLE